MYVQTVLGAVAPDSLGPTLPHEHLFIDGSGIWTDPTTESWVGDILAGGPGGPALDDIAFGPVKMEFLGEILRAPHLSRDNLVVHDRELLEFELGLFAATGGRTLVDLTNIGIGRDPEGLQDISRATGVNIVMGSGYYVEASHSPDMRDRREEDIAEELIREILDGVGETGVRPGIIGEIGTGNPMTDQEAKVLRAACRAQRVTGLPLNIHVSLQTGLGALDLALAQGVDPARVTISHCDTFSNPEYQLAVAERGAWVSFDNFGANWFFGTRASAGDGQRVDDIVRLMERGYVNQILVSHDVGTKIQLTRYGGFGYAYISRFIEPLMRAQGISDAEIEILRVFNPARMLAIAGDPPVTPA